LALGGEKADQTDLSQKKKISEKISRRSGRVKGKKKGNSRTMRLRARSGVTEGELSERSAGTLAMGGWP